MKNYDETINTVFERIDQYNLKQAKNKKILTRTVLPIGSLCIAALIGIAVWQGDFFKSEPPATSENSNIVGEKDNLHVEGQETPPSNSGNNVSSTDELSNYDPCKHLCYINQIGIIESVDIAAPHPISEHYYKNWDNKEAVKYLGIDFSAVDEKFNLDSYNHGAWYKKSDDVLVRDYEVFTYSNEKASFDIEASKTFMPRDCITITNEELISTMVGTKNGPVYVKFYGTVGTEAQQQVEKQSTMIAELEYKDVYFRVKAHDISAFDFYQIVSAVANG